MKEVNKLFVNQNATIKETIRVIDKCELKTALVVDENNKLCGVVVDGDIRRGILKGIDVRERVSKVMNENPICAYSNTPTEKIVELIKENKIVGMPLLNENNIVEDFILLSKGASLYRFNRGFALKKHLNRVLVIGGAGYIGSVLVRKLLSKGYSVNVLDNFTYSRESLREIESNPNLKIIEGDTRHIESITTSIRDVDAVVHLAELVGDPACALNPSITQEINCLATQAVASVCKHFQINRLVYASSCSIYGASKNNSLLSENSPVDPVSLYAKIKIASENALMEMKDENFLPTILRLATVFGFSYRPRFDLFVNLLTAKAIRENKINLFGGDQWRPNVHVEDVADTIITTLESPIEVVGGQVFNVGLNENNYTINQVGKLIKQIIPTTEVIIEEKKTDKRTYKVDFRKLKNILNIELKKRVIDGINEIKEFLEKNQDLDYKDKIYSNFKFLEGSNNQDASHSQD